MLRLTELAGDTSLNLEIHPEQGVPLTLVKMAAARLSDPEEDECWCVFDVEWPKNHPHLFEAKRLAYAKGVSLAISNPCFELWLILHHEDFGKFAYRTRLNVEAVNLAVAPKQVLTLVDHQVVPCCGKHVPVRTSVLLNACRAEYLHTVGAFSGGSNDAFWWAQ